VAASLPYFGRTEYLVYERATGYHVTTISGLEHSGALYTWQLPLMIGESTSLVMIPEPEPLVSVLLAGLLLSGIRRRN